jgi:predicted nucleotidyltransferase
MGSAVNRLAKKGLISPPGFVVGSVQYETIMGSESYGVSSGASDHDVYGFCIPPKEILFPHLSGEIFGFGKQLKRFEQYQENHVAEEAKVWDISIYSIVKYFQLVMENNPNMIDSLFTPVRCVLHITKIGNMVRDARRMFLHKGSYHKFRGYSYSQVHKMKTKNPEGKRKETVDKYGFDLKFAYHVVRLLGEAEQILTEGDLDLERDRERLKAIRNGEWTMEMIEEFFQAKEKVLEECYHKSALPYGPDEKAIKELLLNCLEEHYGDLHDAVYIPDRNFQALLDIRKILDQVGM